MMATQAVDRTDSNTVGNPVQVTMKTKINQTLLASQTGAIA